MSRIRKLFGGLSSFSSKSTLANRILVAGLLIGGSVGITLIGSAIGKIQIIAVTLFFVVGGMCAFETARLFARDPQTLRYDAIRGVSFFGILLFPIVNSMISSLFASMHGVQWLALPQSVALGLYGMLCGMVLFCEGRNDFNRAKEVAASLPVAVLLVGGGASSLIALASLPNCAWQIWWLVITVAVNDSGAYFAGKRFGRRPLSTALSPNKTIEGWMAGLLCGAGVGILLWPLMVHLDDPLVVRVAISMLVVISAQLADLTKSYLKRLRGVKDTGSILGAHGGMLDRFDALLGGAAILAPFLVRIG